MPQSKSPLSIYCTLSVKVGKTLEASAFVSDQIDNLRISRNASGLEANIHALVT